jgi:hypothetical protein
MSNNPPSETTDLPAGEELARLLERAEKGDSTVLPQLRRVLDESPALWQGYGDLSLQAQGALVQLAGGNNLLLCESLMRQMAALKAELMGESPSPLEKLLAGRVAACWLQVSYYDGLIAQTRQGTPAQAKLLQQQQDTAHRRYLSAVTTLATIRKLLTPPRSPVEIASKLAGERAGLRCAHLGDAAQVRALEGSTRTVERFSAAYQARIDAVFTAPGATEWLNGMWKMSRVRERRRRRPLPSEPYGK